MCICVCVHTRVLSFLNSVFYLVAWGFSIHRLHLFRGGKTPPNQCPGYDTKQSNGEVPVILDHWGMRSTRSLPSLPDPLCPGVVKLDRVLCMGEIELNCILMLNWTVWNRTVWLNWISFSLYLFLSSISLAKSFSLSLSLYLSIYLSSHFFSFFLVLSFSLFLFISSISFFLSFFPLH